MKNHYQPELEEYTLGMECKIQTPSGLKTGCFPDVFLLNLELDQYKEDYNKAAHAIVWIKHLDKEDIESFGFAVKSDYGAGTTYHLGNAFRLDTVKHAGITYPLHSVRIFKLGIFDEVYDKLFDGVIKNKSELKKVLTQVQIIK